VDEHLWHVQSHCNGGTGVGAGGDDINVAGVLVSVMRELTMLVWMVRRCFSGFRSGVRGLRGEEGEGGMERWEGLKGRWMVRVSMFGMMTPRALRVLVVCNVVS
jgi:hypothetical protein